jgi:AcrR family transcriptional regulator
VGVHAPVIEDLTVERIRDAALTCFCRHGYAGTSIREIAAAANISVAGLYHHVPSKRAILTELIDATHDGLLARTEATVAEAGDESGAQLEAAVWAHCDFHTRFRRESFIGNTELRSLGHADRERIIGKRDRQKLIFRDIISTGAERGVFDVADPPAVTRAILTMCTAIATWYDPRGPEAPRQIAESYVELAARMTGQKRPALVG